MKKLLTSDSSRLYLLFATAAILFFSSGFSALALQTSWKRILSQTIGIDYYSTVVIISLFMLGLGLGSYVGGILSRRMKQPLYAFIIAELLISLYAYFSNDILRAGQAWSLLLLSGDISYASLIVDFLVYFVLMITPITLMGISLPIIVHVLRHFSFTGSVTGYLYGINIFGAVFGASVAGLYLNALYGLSFTLHLVAFLNAGIALLAFIIIYLIPSKSHEEADATAHLKIALIPKRLVALSLLVGFIALGYELLYFRLFSYTFGLAAYNFPIILSAYLLHLGFGTFICGLLIRFNVPLALIIRIAILGAISSTLLIFILPYAINYWHSEGVSLLFIWTSKSENHLMLNAAVALLCLTPVTFLSMFFPAIVQKASNKGAHTGELVAKLYLVQTIGNFLGAVVTGTVLVVWLGTLHTTLLFMVILALLALPQAQRYFLSIEGSNSVQYGLVLAIFIVLMSSPMLINTSFFKTVTYKNIPPERVLEKKEGTIFIYPYDDDRRKIRIGAEPSLSYSHTDHMECYHSWPVDFGLTYLNREPEKTLVVGIGSAGFPLVLTNLYPEAQHDVVELLSVAKEEMQQYGSTDIQNMVNNVNFYVMDGERFVNKTLKEQKGTYDLIQVGVLHVTSSGAGNLFTKEFLIKLETLLSPDGVLMFNAYANSVRAALDLFPNVAVGALKGSGIAQVVLTNNTSTNQDNFVKKYNLVRKEMNEHPKICPKEWPSRYFILNRESITDLVKNLKPQMDDLPLTEYFLHHKTTLTGSRDSRRWPKNKADFINADLDIIE